MTRSSTLEFTEAITHIRSLETVEQVYALKDSLEVQKLVAAWSTARLSEIFGNPSAPRLDSIAELWDWLWSQRNVDLNNLASKLGASRQRTAAALEVARGNRLIYPDGTVHEHALLYIRALVARDLGVKPAQLGRR